MSFKQLFGKLDDRIKLRDAVHQTSQWIRRLRVTGSRPDHLAQTYDSGSEAETAMIATSNVADHETRDPRGAALRATRLAHEAGIRCIDQELTNLDTYRRLAVAIASATVLALTIPISLLGQHARFNNLGTGAALGFVGFLLSLYVLVKCLVKIYSPLPGESVQNPKRIIARYVDCPQQAQSEQEVYGGLAMDLGEYGEAIRTTVRQRWGCVGPLVFSSVLIPVTTLVVLLDAYQLPLST